MLWLMPQPATPEAAVRDIQRNIRAGADVLKLFTGTYVARARIKPMQVDIARVSVETAHAAGEVAFAHPSNLAGLKVALDSGVDALAHTPDTTDGIADDLIAQMAQKASMIPTLKMFASTVTNKSSYLDPIYAIVRRFREYGGRLLFGTDVGYMDDYTTEKEFEALERCGLTPLDVLRMLTVYPQQNGWASRVRKELSNRASSLISSSSDPIRPPIAKPSLMSVPQCEAAESFGRGRISNGIAPPSGLTEGRN
jgi:imidazolonepropionase-like amidohydrolase